jgi:pantothenate kinase type III
MFGSRTETTTYRGRTVIDARGGISGGPILTGVVVAFGAMFLLSALVGGVLTAIGLTAEDVTTSDAIQAGIGAGVILVAAQFLAYFWGGYTAGRMARGAGAANGALVPLIAIIVAVLVGAVVASLGATANLNLPFSTNRLPLENDLVVDWGLAISIAALAAMFLGGAIGGALGSRWHTKLERRTLDEAPGVVEERQVDLRDNATATGSTTTGSPVVTTSDGTVPDSETSTIRR